MVKWKWQKTGWPRETSVRVCWCTCDLHGNLPSIQRGGETCLTLSGSWAQCGTQRDQRTWMHRVHILHRDHHGCGLEINGSSSTEHQYMSCFLITKASVSSDNTYLIGNKDNPGINWACMLSLLYIYPTQMYSYCMSLENEHQSNASFLKTGVEQVRRTVH